MKTIDKGFKVGDYCTFVHPYRWNHAQGVGMTQEQHDKAPREPMLGSTNEEWIAFEIAYQNFHGRKWNPL